MTKLINIFFEKSLFDRIIIYILLSEFLVKVIFEAVLGQDSFYNPHNKQWIFYSLLAMDYIISLPRLKKIQITLNYMSLFAFIVLIMIFHGLTIGVLNQNQPFEIFNDTVPLLMLSLNILRMQSFGEKERVPDFQYILRISLILAVGAIVIGIFAQIIGRPTKPELINTTIFFPLVAAACYKIKPLPIFIPILSSILILFSLDDLNRTNMLFLLIVTVFFCLSKIINNPAKGSIVIIMMTITLLVVTLVIPEDSKTYQRVISTSQIDFSTREGSIGERQAEQDAVERKLENMGWRSQLLGLGFGGVYEVQFTHSMLVNYGHAHYAWVWFNLRFGKIGYFYMIIMFGALVYNGIRSIMMNSSNGYFIGFICLISLIYMFTYINAVFLLSGLPFLYLYRKANLQKSTCNINT